MPHSSGGGSHGGGFHGGSHGGHGASSIRRSYFSGSKRYVYYHNNRPEYIFAITDPTKIETNSLIASVIVAVVFVTLSLIASIVLIISSTKPLKSDLYRTLQTSIISLNDSELNLNAQKTPDVSDENDIQIFISSYMTTLEGVKGAHIYDNAGILKNPSGLQRELNTFYQKSNISPTFVTVNNEDWINKYSSLEEYAYDLYINTYSDECHWVIVYSQPAKTNPLSNDWYFEGMQGDFTDPILSTSVTRKFNKTVYDNLMSNKYSVEDAFAAAFSTAINQRILKPFTLKNIAIVLFFIFASISIGFLLIYAVVPRKKYRNAMECPSEFIEETCPSCAGVYIANFHTTCPYCHVPIYRGEREVMENKDKNIIL